MIKTNAVRLLLMLLLIGVWISLHYLFDKKDAEGLTIYAIIGLGILGVFLDRRYIARRGKKGEQ